MKIFLESIHGELNFKGTNERGQSLHFSGNKEAVSPMESVLMAVAACNAIDVEIKKKKMRQNVTDVKVEVSGVRADAVPAVFTKIDLHYIISGDLKEEKGIKAVEMSMNEYCSVSKMLAHSVEIGFTVEVRPDQWNEQM